MSMWTAFTEIDKAVAKLGFSNREFSELSPELSQEVLTVIKEKFLGGKDPFFWWEHYRDAESWHPQLQGFELLQEICPDREVYLIPQGEDEERVYISSPTVIAKVLGECAAFEYTIAGQAYDWLITETHQDTVIAVGERAKLRLRSASS
jgi:hypothetical protein